MRRALQIYGKTMLLLPPKKRFLIDVPRKTFNFLALYHFMQFLKEDGDGWVQVRIVKVDMSLFVFIVINCY